MKNLGQLEQLTNNSKLTTGATKTDAWHNDESHTILSPLAFGQLQDKVRTVVGQHQDKPKATEKTIGLHLLVPMAFFVYIAYYLLFRLLTSVAFKVRLISSFAYCGYP